MIEDFKIAHHVNIFEFEKICKQFLDDGYLLHGYVFAVKGSIGDKYFNQAFIKEKTENEPTS